MPFIQLLPRTCPPHTRPAVCQEGPGDAIADATASWHKPPVGKAEVHVRIGPHLIQKLKHACDQPKFSTSRQLEPPSMLKKPECSSLRPTSSKDRGRASCRFSLSDPRANTQSQAGSEKHTSGIEFLSSYEKMAMHRGAFPWLMRTRRHRS